METYRCFLVSKLSKHFKSTHVVLHARYTRSVSNTAFFTWFTGNLSIPVHANLHAVWARPKELSKGLWKFSEQRLKALLTGAHNTDILSMCAVTGPDGIVLTAKDAGLIAIALDVIQPNGAGPLPIAMRERNHAHEHAHPQTHTQTHINA